MTTRGVRAATMRGAATSKKGQDQRDGGDDEQVAEARPAGDDVRTGEREVEEGQDGGHAQRQTCRPPETRPCLRRLRIVASGGGVALGCRASLQKPKHENAARDGQDPANGLEPAGCRNVRPRVEHPEENGQREGDCQTDAEGQAPGLACLGVTACHEDREEEQEAGHAQSGDKHSVSGVQHRFEDAADDHQLAQGDERPSCQPVWHEDQDQRREEEKQADHLHRETGPQQAKGVQGLDKIGDQLEEKHEEDAIECDAGQLGSHPGLLSLPEIGWGSASGRFNHVRAATARQETARNCQSCRPLQVRCPRQSSAGDRPYSISGRCDVRVTDR